MAALATYQTRLSLVSIPNRCKNRLLFGTPTRIVAGPANPPASVSSAYFAPGQIVGLDLWESNDYGTTYWRVFVFKALIPGSTGQTIPHVSPAVHVLLDVQGAQRAKLLLKWLMRMQLTTDILDWPAARFEAASFRFNSLPIQRLGEYVARIGPADCMATKASRRHRPSSVQA